MAIGRPTGLEDLPGSGAPEPHGPPEPIFLADWLDRQLSGRDAKGRSIRKIQRIPFHGEWVAIVLSFALLFVLGLPYRWLARIEFIEVDPARATLQLWYLLIALAMGLRIGWVRRLLFEMEVRRDERRRTWHRLMERKPVRNYCGYRKYVKRRLNLFGAVILAGVGLGFFRLHWSAFIADMTYIWNGVVEPSFDGFPAAVGKPDVLFAVLVVYGVDWIVFLTHLFLRKPTV